jgi:hypothetical protein
MPVKGAVVSVSKLDGQVLYRVTTNEQGAGQFDLESEATLRLDIAALEMFPLQAEQAFAQEARELTYEMSPLGELRVRVVTAGEQPVTKAFVAVTPDRQDSVFGGHFLPASWPEFRWLERQDGQVSDPLHQLSLTNELGVYTAVHLPCGVPLIASASRAVPPVSAHVVIPPDTRTASVELKAFEFGCLVGRVVWDDGSPAVGVVIGSVSLDSDGAGPNITHCRTDGSFKLCALPHGPFRWRIDIPGELSRCSSIDEPQVDVGTIRLPKLYDVAVHIVASGLPADDDFAAFRALIYHNGRLIAYPGFPHRLRGGLEGFSANGWLKLMLPAGEVHLDLLGPLGVLCSRSMRVPSPPIEIDIGSFISELRLTNLPIDPSSPFDVCLVPVASQANVHPYLSASSIQYSSSGLPRAMTWLGTTLSIGKQNPGVYDVFVTPRVGGSVHPGRATLLPGQVTVLDCNSLALASIRGTVSDSEGHPIAQFPVIACNAALESGGERSRQRVRTSSNSGGQFQLDKLSVGNWIVCPESLGPHARIAKTVLLEAGAVANVELVAGLPGDIHGHVRRDAKPVDSALLFIQPRGDFASAYARQETHSDGEGAFAFKNLCPGSYEVHLSVAGQAKDQWNYQGRYVDLAASQTLTLDFDLDEDEVDIDLSLNGSPLEGVESASAFTQNGFCSLHKVADRPNRFRGKLSPGPSLVLVDAPKSFVILDDMWTPPCSYSAYIAHVPRDAPTIAVDIHGTDVVVQATDVAEPMPTARLVSIGPFSHVCGPDDPCGIIYFDESPGLRRFPAIPSGSRIEFISGPRQFGRIELELQVGSETEELVPWPPPH